MQSGGLLLSSLVDSKQRRCPVDLAKRLWLAMSESDSEVSKTVPELVLYTGTDVDVEATVESNKMTKNGAEHNASSGAANGVGVSKLTSAFMSFQITFRPFTE